MYWHAKIVQKSQKTKCKIKILIILYVIDNCANIKNKRILLYIYFYIIINIKQFKYENNV